VILQKYASNIWHFPMIHKGNAMVDFLLEAVMYINGIIEWPLSFAELQ